MLSIICTAEVTEVTEEAGMGMTPWLITFFLGVIASLVATMLWVLILNIMSQRCRKFFYGAVDLILKTDLKFAYIDSSTADEDIIKEMQKSSKIYIYTGRGQFLQRQEYADAFEKESTDVKVILPVPDSENKWLIQRAQEMNAINKGFTANTLAGDIQGIANFLQPNIDTNRIKLHFSDSQHIGKIIIMDNSGYFVPYQKNIFGKDTKVYNYKIGSYMYNWLQRYFDALWEEDVEWPRIEEE